MFLKRLSPNDNSKNQVYLGGDFRVINVLPAGEPRAATSGQHGTPIFKAPLALSWLDERGVPHPAPSAQLILYPQYPEVRLSGFLRGAHFAPNELLTVRSEGRTLLLGVTADRRVLGYVAAPDSMLARELLQLPESESAGVLTRIALSQGDSLEASRSRLLRELCRISSAGWISGWRLHVDGRMLPESRT